MKIIYYFYKTAANRQKHPNLPGECHEQCCVYLISTEAISMSLKWSFLVSCSTKSNTSSSRARRNTVYIPRRVISQNWEKRPHKMQRTPFSIGVIFTLEVDVWKKKLCLLLMLCSDGHGAKNISLSISDENCEVSVVSTQWHQNINTISSPVKYPYL